MSPVIHQIIIIFFGIALGYASRKAGILTEKATTELSNIVVKIILPFYLFSAIAGSDASVDASGVLSAIGLSSLVFVISGAVALLIVPLLKPPKDDRGVYMFEILCGNVTYIGIPVCAALFGDKGAFYASLLNIPFNLLCFSLGIYLLCGKMPLKRILNPAFLASVLATIIYILKISLPEVLIDACKFVGQATSPCAMLVIGSALASVPFKDIFGEWRAIPYVVIRLFLIGALVYLVMGLLTSDPVLRGSLTILSSMPAATNSTMLCSIYGGNRTLSAKLIFISTALCALTIPLWAKFLT